jgi:hypothetical protein
MKQSFQDTPDQAHSGGFVVHVDGFCQLLQVLRDRRSMTPKEIWDGLGVTRQEAIKLLQPLLAKRSFP